MVHKASKSNYVDYYPPKMNGKDLRHAYQHLALPVYKNSHSYQCGMVTDIRANHQR